MKNRAVLAIDGDNFGPGPRGQFHDQRAGHDECFFVGQRHALAASTAAHVLARPALPTIAADDAIDVRMRGDPRQRFVTDKQFRLSAGNVDQSWAAAAAASWMIANAGRNSIA